MFISVELDKACDYANEIIVYNDGMTSAYGAGEKAFEEILVGWKHLLDGAHEMPAFGVSLNYETVKAIKSGLWVEFVFGEKYESNGMPFEKLLIKAEKPGYGFNIIRYTVERGYDGRCFYYDLAGKDMSNFYDILFKF